MSPAAWSSLPETVLKRTVATRSAYTLSPRRIAGNFAVADWQRTLGDDGASDSAFTSQVPPNASAPAGGLPAASLSKFHSSVCPAVAVCSPGWYFTCGVPPHPADRPASARSRVTRLVDRDPMSVSVQSAGLRAWLTT